MEEIIIEGVKVLTPEVLKGVFKNHQKVDVCHTGISTYSKTMIINGLKVTEKHFLSGREEEKWDWSKPTYSGIEETFPRTSIHSNLLQQKKAALAVGASLLANNIVVLMKCKTVNIDSGLFNLIVTDINQEEKPEAYEIYTIVSNLCSYNMSKERLVDVTIPAWEWLEENPGKSKDDLPAEIIVELAPFPCRCGVCGIFKNCNDCFLDRDRECFLYHQWNDDKTAENARAVKEAIIDYRNSL